MYVARGMFRLWVLFSALWFIAVTIVAGALIADEPYLAPRNYVIPNNQMEPFLLTTDVDAEFVKNNNKLLFPYNVTVYTPPSIPSAALDDWAPGFAREYVQPRYQERWTARWWLIAGALGWGMGLPAILLAFGLALRWAFAGFKAPTPA